MDCGSSTSRDAQGGPPTASLGDALAAVCIFQPRRSDVSGHTAVPLPPSHLETRGDNGGWASTGTSFTGAATTAGGARESEPDSCRMYGASAPLEDRRRVKLLDAQQPQQQPLASIAQPVSAAVTQTT